MFPPYHHHLTLYYYWLLPTVVLALGIPTDQNSITQPSLTLLTNVTGTNSPLNASIMLTGQEVHCEGHLRRPQVSSCADAVAQMPISRIIGDRAESYGPRGQGNLDVGLPIRWISFALLILVSPRASERKKKFQLPFWPIPQPVHAWGVQHRLRAWKKDHCWSGGAR